MPRVWDWQKWGSVEDPIHQSDISGLLGKFGCPQQFKRRKEETAAAEERPDFDSCNGKLIAGNAVHAVIERVLRSEPARAALLAGNPPADRTLAYAFQEELDRERAGRAVHWYKTDPAKWQDDCVAMLVGLMSEIRSHVAEVVLAEAGFIYELGGVWLTGAVDLVYRARMPDGSASERLSFADWKTGANRPTQIELNHGWQSGIYAAAMAQGIFIPAHKAPALHGYSRRQSLEIACINVATPRQYKADPALIAHLDGGYEARFFHEYPERIRYVHLRDYVPYTRRTKKRLTRPDELQWAGIPEPQDVRFEKGDIRGPAWYRVVRSEGDVKRLESLIRSVVGWVRFGRFPPAPGELCERCRFRDPCLMDGYKPTGEDLRHLERLTNGLDFDGLDGEI